MIVLEKTNGVFMKNIKFNIILLIIFIVIIILLAVFYTSNIILDKRVITKNSYTENIGNTDINSIWTGTFQLSWNELISMLGKKIVFENYDSVLVDSLNKQYFTKDMLSEEDYYLKVSKTTKNLKKEILNDINEKWGLNDSDILDKIDFRDDEEGYTIYSILIKEFEFLNKFDHIGAWSFNDSKEQVEYFGVNNNSKDILYENLEVLFYNDENDFAVKLYTKEGEEVLLYRNRTTDNFENIYKELVDKTNNYTGEHEFGKNDVFYVPCISLDTTINYGELCGRKIEGTGIYIKNAIQNIKFELNEKGGNLKSETALQDVAMSNSKNERFFEFEKNFIIFLKEENKEKPYFALKIDNTDILVKKEMAHVSIKENEKIRKMAKDILEDEELIKMFKRQSYVYYDDEDFKEILSEIEAELSNRVREYAFPKSFEDFISNLSLIANDLENSDRKIIVEKLKSLDLTTMKNDDLKERINNL